MNNIDILAIGDIATEPFIRIDDAEARCDKFQEHCKLCFSYGGKIPYESAVVCHAVGNSSNVAIGASRLGLNSYLMSYVGNDTSGKEDIEQLEKENVHTDYMQTIDGMDSNYHYVLWYHKERTILVKHTEFPYSFPNDLKEPKWIYFSSLAKNSIDYHKEINEYVATHPDVSLAFQPGTFQMKLGTEVLANIYKNTKVLLCNYQESKTILNTEEKDISILIKRIHDLGPKIIVITDGPNGAYSYDGNDILFIKAIGSKAVESTGAGDAFSGSFVSALALGKDIREAMTWGTINASSVISFVGPHQGLLTRAQIEEYIKDMSNDYKPIKIN